MSDPLNVNNAPHDSQFSTVNIDRSSSGSLGKSTITTISSHNNASRVSITNTAQQERWNFQDWLSFFTGNKKWSDPSSVASRVAFNDDLKFIKNQAEDAAIFHEKSVLETTERHQEFDFRDIPMSLQQQAIGIQEKNSALRQSLKEALAAIKQLEKETVAAPDHSSISEKASKVSFLVRKMASDREALRAGTSALELLASLSQNNNENIHSAAGNFANAKVMAQEIKNQALDQKVATLDALDQGENTKAIQEKIKRYDEAYTNADSILRKMKEKYQTLIAHPENKVQGKELLTAMDQERQELEAVKKSLEVSVSVTTDNFEEESHRGSSSMIHDEGMLSEILEESRKTTERGSDATRSSMSSIDDIEDLMGIKEVDPELDPLKEQLKGYMKESAPGEGGIAITQQRKIAINLEIGGVLNNLTKLRVQAIEDNDTEQQERIETLQEEFTLFRKTLGLEK